MSDATRLLAIVVAVALGRTGGVQTSRSYCIGTGCFTVSQQPADFDAAKSGCERLGGHLMTVRSSVSQDVLLMVLGNVSGRFWIGLHLPTGCPDPSTELNGFRWVTGDTQTDFTNWPRTLDTNCSSSSCVSVSSADDFKWTREPCVAVAAGFLCEFTFEGSCAGLKAGPGETLNYSTPIGIQGEDLLSLPPGSVAVRLPSETKYVCFSGRWIQAPWTCDVLEGGCEYKCTPDPEHEPVCYCPAGQTIHPGNKVTCEEIKADPCASLRCAHACYQDEERGAYACACWQGFRLAEDGRSCVDFNDCTDARQCPGENSRCVNTAGGFECVCEDGYTDSGGVCVDVNECVSAPCEHICENVQGGYTCACYSGYKEDPVEPHRCLLHCGEEACPAQCDPNDQYLCYCPNGYILEESESTTTMCIDIDECAMFFCDQGCENTYGGYVCSCQPGYELENAGVCVKTEEEPDTEGSGAPSAPPSITAAPPHPDPTSQPSGLTVGGVVGIVVGALLFLALVVFLACRVLCGGRKTEGEDGVKAPEDEGHTLQPVTSDA